MRIQLHAMIAFACLWCHQANAEDWTRFRGPNGQGVSAEVGLPTKWSANDNVVWKTPIPGSAWSSPIILGDQIFLTTATEEGAAGRILCVNRRSGEVDWNVEVHRQELGDKRKENSYATPTPVTDGKRVYAVFADGAIVAVDLTGKPLWKNTDVKFHSLHGLSASPLLVGDQLVMPFDGNSREDRRIGWKEPWGEAVLLSLDTATGKTRWRGERGASRVAHVSPILIEDGKQIVSAAGDCVQGFDAQSGKRIWTVYSQGEGVTPSPVVGEGLIFTSSGFEAPTIRAIRPGGQGDVTESHIEWEQKRGVPAMVSFLHVRPWLYSITRDNILYCMTAATGEILWQRRLKGTYSASPILADGKIYISSEDGVTLVLRPGPKYDEVAVNELDDPILASMAVSDGHLYVRTAKNLFCLGGAE